MATASHYTLLTITSNPFSVNLPTNNEHSNLSLMAYSVSGAPTTAGVPNNLYFNMIIEDLPSVGNAEWIRNDGLAGVPLAIQGSFTHEDYNPARLIRSGYPTTFGRFNLRFTDDTGNLATFDTIVMWLHMQ